MSFVEAEAGSYARKLMLTWLVQADPDESAALPEYVVVRLLPGARICLALTSR
jgi:hypothetical protein